MKTKQSTVEVGKSYYTIYSDDQGSRVIHILAKELQKNDKILFKSFQHPSLTLILGIEEVFNHSEDAYQTLKEKNKKSLSYLSTENLLDTLIYCAEQKHHQPINVQLANAEYIALIKEEITQRTK